MREELFIISSRRQTEWGFMVALSTYLLNIGAGLLVAAGQIGYLLGSTLSVILMIAGILILLAHLKRRSRFWRSFMRPSTSWISRGVILILIAIVLNLLYVAPSYEQFSWLPWTSASVFGRALLLISTVAAFLVMLYTGFELADNVSIPFWNTPLLPILTMLTGLMSGIGIIHISLVGVTLETANIHFLTSTQLAIILSTLVVIAVYLLVMSSSNIAAKESVRLLLKGKLSPAFLLGVVTVLIVSLLLTLYSYLTTLPIPLVVAGVLVIIGGFILRYLIQIAGYHPPLA